MTVEAKNSKKANLIKGFETKAKQLSEDFAVKVIYETFTEKIKGKETGNIFVAYLRSPNIFAQAQAMDLLLAGKVYEAGLKLWSAVFLPDPSSKEIETNQKYKIGLLPKISAMLEAEAPDLKKN